MNAASSQSPPHVEHVPPPRKTWLYKAGQMVCRFVALTGFCFKAYGAKNVPQRGGVLIVANHQSVLDPVMLAVNLRRPVSFMAKRELFDGHSAFAWLIRNLNAFPVRQGEGDVGAVRETIKRLQAGHVLIVFPEGERTPDGRIGKLEGGIGLIIRRAGPDVRVVPAAVDGAFKAWPKHRKRPRFCPIQVKYGPPLSLAHLKAAQIMETIDGHIRRLFDDLRNGRIEP
jgi:1-acyl-sn-glycerol-3-phosphate acyltransferase